ncbi:hypothetical protein B0T21DRAFT_128671 [Apiosordaria backusii]|uniref:Uncharacterized protein n=1 Tax=Apiosordaria backusii TaxID=314023 RepID=A0AA40EN33_9PEZI|nr:hypothetical protein B0T21DRAFT_128671 [Apiosordaria backusii]
MRSKHREHKQSNKQVNPAPPPNQRSHPSSVYFAPISQTIIPHSGQKSPSERVYDHKPLGERVQCD